MSQGRGARTRILGTLWRRILGDESWVRRNGDLRERERWGLVHRPNYAYGMLRAADMAAYFGHRKTTVCEFGVANGDGLVNMIELAARIERETGIEIRVVGFDTGEGLPEVKGYQDHPEIWNTGDFAMQGRDALERRIASRAELCFGDIKDTVGPFMETLSADAPLGFVSIDVDIYSGTVSALRCLTGAPELYNPAVSMYFDDVGFFFANRWCGELLAIEEFNQRNPLRKIDSDRSLPGRRAHETSPFYRNMYVCHVLDHDARNDVRDRSELSIGDHHGFMAERFLY